jgi:Carboxypeptidase regulatory-like domain
MAAQVVYFACAKPQETTVRRSCAVVLPSLEEHPVKRIGPFSVSAVLLLVLNLTALSQTRQNIQTFTLQGEVSDVSDAPIENAFVLVHRGSDKADVTAKLDEKGRFELPLSPGYYDVFVAADGFSPFCKKVEISANSIATLKAILRPDSEHMQQSGPKSTIR